MKFGLLAIGAIVASSQKEVDGAVIRGSSSTPEKENVKQRALKMEDGGGGHTGGCPDFTRGWPEGLVGCCAPEDCTVGCCVGYPQIAGLGTAYSGWCGDPAACNDYDTCMTGPVPPSGGVACGTVYGAASAQSDVIDIKAGDVDIQVYTNKDGDEVINIASNTNVQSEVPTYTYTSPVDMPLTMQCQMEFCDMYDSICEVSVGTGVAGAFVSPGSTQSWCFLTIEKKMEIKCSMECDPNANVVSSSLSEAKNTPPQQQQHKKNVVATAYENLEVKSETPKVNSFTKTEMNPFAKKNEEVVNVDGYELSSIHVQETKTAADCEGTEIFVRLELQVDEPFEKHGELLLDDDDDDDSTYWHEDHDDFDSGDVGEVKFYTECVDRDGCYHFSIYGADGNLDEQAFEWGYAKLNVDYRNGHNKRLLCLGSTQECQEKFKVERRVFGCSCDPSNVSNENAYTGGCTEEELDRNEADASYWDDDDDDDSD